MTLVGNAIKPLFRVAQSDLGPQPAADDVTTQRLHQVVLTVTECCHLTLRTPRFAALIPKLDGYEKELRGFAYEGAGVGLAALDTWLPWRQRTREFVLGDGAPYLYAVYLGAGMALARMRRNPDLFRVRLEDPIFSWVVLDGYGFHEGFFSQARYVDRREEPRKLSGYARRAFDHGLGRSIWFSSGARVDRVAATIGSFPVRRQADLWSGVGLACGYTGGVDRPTLEQLRAEVGEHLDDIAVGVVVAAKARHMVGNLAVHNEDACRVLCGLSSAEAASVADAAIPSLPTYGAEPAYEQWRQGIRRRLAGTTSIARRAS
jgi:hypothetical protein